MSIDNVIKKFEHFISVLKENRTKIDAKSLNNLFEQTFSDIEQFFIVDRDILNILKDKRHFSSTSELKKFVKDLTGVSSQKRSRRDVEIENTKILMSKSFDKRRIESLLPPPKSVRRTQAKPKKKVKALSKESSNLILQWINLPEEDLRREFTRFKTVSDLKNIADSLFKGNDRRYRKRIKVENIIIERINERKALFQFGK